VQDGARSAQARGACGFLLSPGLLSGAFMVLSLYAALLQPCWQLSVSPGGCLTALPPPPFLHLTRRTDVQYLTTNLWQHVAVSTAAKMRSQLSAFVAFMCLFTQRVDAFSLTRYAQHMQTT